jgi:hypothetical protein
MSDALEALRAVDFDWVRSLDSIWSDSVPTGAPNEALVQSVAAQFFEETRGDVAHPRGAVLLGQSGIGKTHLVGLLRKETWNGGGWFVLLDVLGLTDFWRSAALSFLTSLLQEMPDGRRQLEAVLAGVARRLGGEKAQREVEAAYDTPGLEPRRIVDLLVRGLMNADLQSTLQHRDVFRALCLLRSSDLDTVSLAHSWLQGYDADEQARAAQGFVAPPPAPVELVRGMSWIMSLAGPTLVAADQIDGVVNPSSIAVHGDGDLGPVQGLGEVLAAGLLQVHDVRRRGKTIVTCLFDSWEVLKARGLLPFRQRFDDPIVMVGMNTADSIRALIVGRLAPAFRAANFKPPYPCWPFSEAAITSAASGVMTPRAILMRCDAFRRACLERGKVEICDTLIDAPPPARVTATATGLDAELARLGAAADLAGLIHASDDAELGRLLRDMLDSYVRQIEPTEAIDVVSKGHPAQRIPPLHGRLTFIYHEQNDRERHFCFRVLEHTHAISFQARLRAALTASGISSQIPDRHLVIVRRGPVPSGPKTRQLFDVFRNAGGILINPSDDDLRHFVALRMLQDQTAANGRHDELESWLRSRKPLLATGFFKQAGLSPPPVTPAPAPPSPARTKASVRPQAARPEPPGSVPLTPAGAAHGPPGLQATPECAAQGASSRAQPATPTAGVAVPADAVPIGRRMTLDEEPVSLPISLLRRHVAIIAGSGSGKTVLLRRMVEEAALAGIPAIVIDLNNDLSRLGDPWPERPTSFTPEDDTKAQRYFKTVEVVVWTPGAHAGRPLVLSVMPDFASLGDEKDERQQAVDMAAETLAPLAGAKNQLQRGVLVEALRHFAASGGGDLGRFTALLADLPDGLSPIGHAAKLAAGMADQLHAAVATNPLLRAEGEVLDPKLLFFDSSGRARVSVINLSGLASDAAKEDFVNRLQMTLFSWIKKHPSARGLLYAIDEAQMFLPAQKPALSLGSGVKLVAQARKYGLGMIVATQAPRGVHNQVVSNCTTQLFGKQNAPATIGAAQEIIAASGGRAEDIGKLKTGEFYFATEGSGKPGKVRTPVCLSYHPRNPPTPDEVIARARR